MEWNAGAASSPLLGFGELLLYEDFLTPDGLIAADPLLKFRITCIINIHFNHELMSDLIEETLCVPLPKSREDAP
eukprot:COSAG02_NODE_842_length_16609_cov_117.586675_14_plen_75_part_00